MRMNNLKDVITFYKIVSSGPEAGSGTPEEVFKAYAEIYQPSVKDVQLGNLETEKTSITVIIRNSYPEYLPKVNETFKVETGMYTGLNFDINTVAPVDEGFIKIVGVQI